MFLFLLISYCFCDDILSKYNLDSLKHDVNNPYQCSSGGQQITFNFRTALQVNSTFEYEDCVASVEYGGEASCYGLITPESFNYDQMNNALIFSYSYSKFYYHYNTEFHIFCSKSKSFNASLSSALLQINIYDPAGCEKKKGLSFGSIMLIILAVLFVLYFAIGIPIQYLRKKKGLELIPFIYFWTSLPGLVWLGIKTIFRPCCKKNDFTEIE